MHISARFPYCAAAVAVAVASATLSGAPAKKTAAAKAGFELSVDSIMRGPKLVGYPQTGLRSSGDSSHLYFEWRRPQDEETATWVVGRDGSGLRQLTDTEHRAAPPVNGVWDTAHRRVLFADEGDIALVDSIAGTRRTITRTTGAEANPRWARHETAVTFTRENNLFIVPLEGSETGIVVQLTDVGPKKREPHETESQAFVKTEEQKLIEHTRVEAEKKKKADEKAKAHALPKFELADHQSATDLQLSPDGAHVFLLIVERDETSKRPNVANYVTASSYEEDIPARTYVGDAQDKRRLAVMNLETGATHWIDASFAGTQPPSTSAPSTGAPSTPALQHPAPSTSAPSTASAPPARPQPRDVRWGMPILNTDGTFAVADVRSMDNKDRWLVAVDAESGTPRIVDALHDDAWIREAGGGFGGDASFGWMPDEKQLWFLSERDGWMHLYTVDAAEEHAAARQLTQGKWEVDSAELSADKKKFYLTTSEVHPGERHIYAMPIAGGARTKLTSMTGAASTSEVSPDEKTIGFVYSYSTKPHEVYVMANAPGASAIQITTTPTEEWRSFKWIDPQLVTYKTRDGAEVYARLYTPEMIGGRRDPNAPAVVFVHGAGYAQNAHKYWPSYFREYMFHNLLASRGTSCSIPTTAQARVTAATGAPRSTVTWAARISTMSSTARSFSSRRRR